MPFPPGSDLDTDIVPGTNTDNGDLGKDHATVHNALAQMLNDLRAVLTTDGDLLTRTAGVWARLTRPELTGFVSTTSHGALADARSVSDLVTTATSPIVTSATAVFVAADVGKVISLRTGSTGLTSTIASRQSATQVTLAANCPTTATGGIATFGTDDTVAIQAAITACPAAGTVFFPARESIITTALNCPEDITLRGGGIAENTTGIIASSFGSGPSIAPYLRGAVITQVTAAANGINMLGTGTNVHLHDLGIKFGPAIMFLNTGHGVFASPTAAYGLGHENGIFNPRWDNVVVFGHDGNHVAYYIFNSNLGTFAHLRGHGGGGLYLESDSYGAGFGNAVYVAPFFRMFCGGTANGYTIKAREIQVGEPSMNLLTFLRPQCNILSPNLAPAFQNLGITAPTVAQYLWRNVGPTYPKYVDVIDPDLENDGVTNFPIDFGGMYSGTIVRNGGIMTSVPTGGYSTENRQNPGVPLQPTIVKGAAVGNGTVTVIQGNDQGGVLLVTAGSDLPVGGPPVAGSVVATVTCPTMPPTGIKAVIVQPYADNVVAHLGWYVSDIADNTKTFVLRCNETLYPSHPYQLMFQVIPRNTPNNQV